MEEVVEKPKPVEKWNPTAIKLTGIKIVDFIQGCVAKNRHAKLPLKVIYLKKSNYKRFYDVMQELNYKQFGEYIDEKSILTWDNVDIMEGSALQIEKFQFEYHAPVAQA